MPDALFEEWQKNPPTKSRSNSPAPKPTVGKEFSKAGKRLGVIKQKGRLVPICCSKFLQCGACDTKEKTGKNCTFKHLNPAQFEAEAKKLNDKK